MFAECYDKITQKQALKYYHITDFRKVTCIEAEVIDMTPFDKFKYTNWKSVSEFNPTVHQRVMMDALSVYYRASINNSL